MRATVSLTEPTHELASGPSRAESFRAVLADLTHRPGVAGGLLVAPDGFVIAARLPGSAPEDSLAALIATLGRQLELGAERLGRGPFTVGTFRAERGALSMAVTEVGYLAVLTSETVASPAAGASPAVRQALVAAADAIRLAWEQGPKGVPR